MNFTTGVFTFQTTQSQQDLNNPLVHTVKVLYGDHPYLPSVSIYFQGCDAFPKCAGCHNPETWDFDESFQINFDHLLATVVQKIELLLNKYPQVALAFLGGEPLSVRNRRSAYLIAKFVKEKFEDKVLTIVYTWRMPEDLTKIDIPLDYFDEFVMGRYIKELHQNGFPASSNQIYFSRRVNSNVRYSRNSKLHELFR